MTPPEPQGLYRWLRPALYALPAETAHHLAFGALRAFSAAGANPLLRAWLSPNVGDAMQVQAFGRTLAHPLGLAAGFDKDAVGYGALAASGFSFVEVGTLTAHAQTGNPRPRLFRLPADRALVNRMGFNNGGSLDASRRLAERAQRLEEGVLGVNIGKSKITPEEDAADDYALSAARVGPYADYLVVNVSSPNTPGLRNLQSVEKLAPILLKVRAAADRRRLSPVPLFVKIAPDLADEDVDAVADLASHLGLAGIIATNTTIRRDGLKTESARELGAGGLSGAPLKERALDVIARLRRRLPSATLIAVGGIETSEDARARLAAGADLLQVYTAYVYQGPTFPKRMVEALDAWRVSQ